jgi:hypothetical protein
LLDSSRQTQVALQAELEPVFFRPEADLLEFLLLPGGKPGDR